jgi:hypothetical protein
MACFLTQMAEIGAQPGNRNAAKARKWREAIERALARNSDGKSVAAGLDQAADKLTALAFEGDKWAIDHIADRVDGKVPQALIGGDDDDAPIKFQKVERSLVRPDAKDTDR